MDTRKPIAYPLRKGSEAISSIIAKRCTGVNGESAA
jgi:hypothetical protein